MKNGFVCGVHGRQHACITCMCCWQAQPLPLPCDITNTKRALVRCTSCFDVAPQSVYARLATLSKCCYSTTAGFCSAIVQFNVPLLPNNSHMHRKCSGSVHLSCLHCMQYIKLVLQVTLTVGLLVLIRCAQHVHTNGSPILPEMGGENRLFRVTWAGTL